MGCNFWGVEPLGGPGGNIVGVAKLVRTFTRGPSGVQNKATIEPLGLTVWSQQPCEEVTILKFLLLRPRGGAVAPEPTLDIFRDS